MMSIRIMRHRSKLFTTLLSPSIGLTLIETIETQIVTLLVTRIARSLPIPGNEQAAFIASPRCFLVTCRRRRLVRRLLIHPPTQWGHIDSGFSQRESSAVRLRRPSGRHRHANLMPSSITNPLRPGLWQLVLGLGVMLVLALLPWPLGGPAHAANSFSPGDLVFGLNSSLDGTLEGKLHHYSSDGSTLLNVLYTNSGAFGESGPCFNASRNLFTTNFEGNSMSTFNADGTLASSGLAIGLNEHPNSCIFDAAGNLFVGMSDLNGGFGGGRLLRLDASGLVADTFYTDTEGAGPSGSTSQPISARCSIRRRAAASSATTSVTTTLDSLVASSATSVPLAATRWVRSGGSRFCPTVE